VTQLARLDLTTPSSSWTCVVTSVAVDASRRVAAAGAARIALVDSEVSPLAEGALAVLPVAAAGAGPFDSHVGMLAVANALVAGVAARLRRALTRRIDALEATWVASGVLVEDPR
jgi:DNA-binding MurR/RpiR family transcriptional regulator